MRTVFCGTSSQENWATSSPRGVLMLGVHYHWMDLERRTHLLCAFYVEARAEDWIRMLPEKVIEDAFMHAPGGSSRTFVSKVAVDP